MVKPHAALLEERLELSSPFAQLVGRLLEETQRFYRDRLITLAVFGSVGRGTATAESDVDLLIIATDLPQGRMKRVSKFAQVEDCIEGDIRQMELAGVHIYLSPVIKTPDEVLAGSPLFLDMILDALILCDKENFFQQFLARFKQRLDRLGARRIVQGDRWYWDLKPDYKAGDTFEL